MFSRRAFVAAPFLLRAGLSSADTGTLAAGKPMRVYFNDDSTDLDSLASPFHKFRDDVTDAELAADIDEVVDAGIDVYVNQPGTGWVPFWKSDVYPAAQHYKWFDETFQVKAYGFIKYMIEGGDLVGAALQHCRARGVPIMVSLRLNDEHSIQFSGRSPDFIQAHMKDPNIPDWQKSLPVHMSRVHMEHPEWRIDPSSDKAEDMVWDWSHPEAVAHKLALASELVQKYDVDGLELDYMRAPRFFRDDAAVPDRIRVMTGFVAAVRGAMDSKRRGRELALRVPPKLAAFAALGLDLPHLRAAGINRLNVSSHTFTNQDVDFDAIRAAAKGLSLTLEMAQSKHFLQHQPPRGTDNDTMVLCAPIDDITTAWLAKSKGFDSVSLFNFVYYRRYAAQQPGYDSSHDPPFGVIKKLRLPGRWLAPLQSWFLGTVFTQGFEKFAQMPAQIAPGRPAKLEMQIVPPPQPLIENAILRYVARQNRTQNSSGSFTVAFNGVDLQATADPNASGLPEDAGLPFRAFTLPSKLIRSGPNRVDITQTSGPAAEIPLLEVVTRTSA